MKLSFLEELCLPIQISEYSEKTSLPRYLVQGRRFYTAKYEQFSFVIVELNEGPKDSRIAASELSKYQNAFNSYVAFSFPVMTRTQRNAYVRHSIPFICDPVQIYLPFLGMLFSDNFTEIRKINSQKMTAASQQVFLYLIYKEKKNYSKSEIANALKINPTYITRASEQLKVMGLIDEQKTGRNIFILRRYDGTDMFEHARVFLQNPVKGIKYVKKTEAINQFQLSGLSAVSSLGMLNPSEILVKACYVKDPFYNEIEEVEEPQWQPAETVCKLEAWKYDPKLFAADGIVDPVSLYCTLAEEKDERLLKELETILEEYKWQ